MKHTSVYGMIHLYRSEHLENIPWIRYGKQAPSSGNPANHGVAFLRPPLTQKGRASPCCYSGTLCPFPHLTSNFMIHLDPNPYSTRPSFFGSFLFLYLPSLSLVHLSHLLYLSHAIFYTIPTPLHNRGAYSEHHGDSSRKPDATSCQL
jgi:hypothetical protein